MGLIQSLAEIDPEYGKTAAFALFEVDVPAPMLAPAEDEDAVED
jgi:hypothetical protein